jgi:hypothetical protein
MLKQDVCVYTWYIPRTTTFVLYILVCTYAVQDANLSAHGSSLYLEHAKPFSAQSTSLRHAVHTRLNILHTMLVYRNQPFCTCRVHSWMYSLRMALVGGQLSSSVV